MLKGANQLKSIENVNCLWCHMFQPKKNVYKCVNLFKEGRSGVEDGGGPGRPTEVKSLEVIKSVNNIIQSNRRVTVDAIAMNLSISVGTAQKIVHDDLGYSNVSCRWVPVQSNQSCPVHSVQAINELGWDLPSHPPYSPDLSSSDFDLFGPLKTLTRGTKFESDDEVKRVVSDWMRHQSKYFCAEGIWKLLDRWEKCVTMLIHYVEK